LKAPIQTQQVQETEEKAPKTTKSRKAKGAKDPVTSEAEAEVMLKEESKSDQSNTKANKTAITGQIWDSLIKLIGEDEEQPLSNFIKNSKVVLVTNVASR